MDQIVPVDGAPESDRNSMTSGIAGSSSGLPSAQSLARPTVFARLKGEHNFITSNETNLRYYILP